MLNIESTEQRGTETENGSERSNGTVNFNRISPTKKSGPPQRVGQLFQNFFSWTEPIHSVLDQNFWKFWLNGSRP